MAPKHNAAANILVIATFHLILFQITGSQKDERRPLYNIAHMVNSISEVGFYLDGGANAVESDITFLKNGEAKWAFHGAPCDCFRMCQKREDFGRYLDYIRIITTPGHAKYRKELVLLFLDLKVSNLPSSAKYKAGESLGEKLHKHLFNNGENINNIYVLLSIGHTSDSDVVRGVQRKLVGKYSAEVLDKQVGWDVGLNDRLQDIDGLWERLGVSRNVWLGDGITNCVSYFSNNNRLREAIQEREKNPRFNKVYRWTVDFTFSIKYTLRLGIDGIITNHPERVLSISKESEFVDKYRLATKDDNPWQTIDNKVKSNKKNAPSLDLFASTVSEAAKSFWTFVKEGTRI